MATIIFYEKPGCINNTKQKAILEEAGHTLHAVDILSHPWTKGELLSFLDTDNPRSIMNATAPAIKNHTIDPEQLSFEKAIELMLKDPILIRRPLLDIEGEKMQGFDNPRLKAWLGSWQNKEDVTTCPNLAAQSCDEQKQKAQ